MLLSFFLPKSINFSQNLQFILHFSGKSFFQNHIIDRKLTTHQAYQAGWPDVVLQKIAQNETQP
jgi:hypothetical protein